MKGVTSQGTASSPPISCWTATAYVVQAPWWIGGVFAPVSGGRPIQSNCRSPWIFVTNDSTSGTFTGVWALPTLMPPCNSKSGFLVVTKSGAQGPHSSAKRESTPYRLQKFARLGNAVPCIPGSGDFSAWGVTLTMLPMKM